MLRSEQTISNRPNFHLITPCVKEKRMLVFIISTVEYSSFCVLHVTGVHAETVRQWRLWRKIVAVACTPKYVS